MTQNRTFLSPIVMLGAAPKGRRQCPMRTAGEPDSRQLRTTTARLAMRAVERQEVIENPKL
jgi:hypothetical protein